MRLWFRICLPVLALGLLGSECDPEVNCYGLNPCAAKSAATSSDSPSRAPATVARSAAIVAAAAGAPLPMLTAFPTCQGTLDVGNSRENPQFGSLGTNVTGSSACFTVNNPLQFTLAEGPVQITIETAAVALPMQTTASAVARFAIEGRSSITGGTASTTPTWTVQAGYLFPHSGSPTGTEPIVFGATLVEANDSGSATPVPAVASVNVDCGVGPPTVLPLNQRAVNVPVQATSVCGASCSCIASAVLTGGASAAAGEAVQRLTVYAFNTNGLCGSNEMCQVSDPANPFCVANFGCSNGSVGMPCDHESQCDRAAGVICGPAGLCEDGSAGASCTQAEDCIAGLSCVASVCSAL